MGFETGLVYNLVVVITFYVHVTKQIRPIMLIIL